MPVHCPGGEIGRRRRLKISRRKACGFDPRPGHHLAYKAKCVMRFLLCGFLAQLVEHFLYTERVGGSSPSGPTTMAYSPDVQHVSGHQISQGAATRV